MAKEIEENNEGRYPLKRKYYTKQEGNKGVYRNRTGGDGPPKKRNKHNAKARGAMGIKPPNHPVLLLKDGKKRFIRGPIQEG
jgi:hypothetical protein